LAAIITASFLLLSPLKTGTVYANGPGGRYVIEEETKTAYIWVIGAWNFETCRILTDNLEHVPQMQDIKALCGDTAVKYINDGIANLYYLGPYHYQIDVKVYLPEIIIKTDYNGGRIEVYAVDPLPGQTITRIEGTINGIPSVCDDYNGYRAAGSLSCTFPVRTLPVIFSGFATSDYGDNSKIVRLRIDNNHSDNSIIGDPNKNAVVIGDYAYAQYNRSMDIPMLWGTGPGQIDGPYALQRVPNETLFTSHYYYYLSGQILLDTGLARGFCDNGGVMGQYANQCGLLAAFDVAETYQNAYNEQITAAAALAGVPNRLVKRIISVESQFWPTAYGIAGENGLYQFTRDGADTLLRWSGPVYLDVCGVYFDNCDYLGYDNLATWQRDVLTNHILADYNNLDYLAYALKANAYQVDRLLENIAGIETAGDYFTYDEMWMITIGNYHTGATVTAAALVQIQQLEQEYNYSNYATALNHLQLSATHYVNRVMINRK